VPTRVIVTDIDGAGRADVVTIAQYVASSSQREGYLLVYRQTSPGAFAAPDTYVVGGYPWDVAVGDMDGDGAPDLVVTDAVTSVVNAPPHVLWLLRQDASRRGHFNAPQSIATGNNLLHTAIVDANGDGAPDIVVDDPLGTSGAAAVLYQDPAARGTFRPAQGIALPGVPTYVAAGDLDRDGRGDLAFWIVTYGYSADRPETGSLAVVRQTPQGTLGAPEIALRITGRNTRRMSVADVDATGSRDVWMFQSPQSTDYHGAIVSAVQSTSMTFTGIETSLAGADGIDDAVLADLDGDTVPDVAVAGSWANQGNVSQLRGRVNVLGSSTNGSYVPRTQYDMSFTVNQVAAGDVDGDGRNDLVLFGGKNEVQVMVQSSTTPGTFAPPRPLR
jgi:hypothetical protein